MANKPASIVIGSERFDFQTLFEAHYPAVARRAMFLIGDRAAAEDITQEVFLKLFNHPPTDASNLPGWLSKVATNLSFNYLKSERTRRWRDMSNINEVEQVTDIFTRIDEVGEVRRALELLTVKDRLCLMLKHSGHSYDEIAAALGIGKGSVGTTISRAQKRFRLTYLRGKETEDAMSR